ncbi:DUF5129 domain-containing protein [Arthrobacter jiangjiafuii]|uniref:DUF5129 domain-containing protein n=1 Tax=Arthrobacter jiangjiafuii TaxID=2817475 RepID=A0A975M7F0_9MICC|nr:DUF5129 domain-containing protein [Arthrobacter jiangjiafuii]MBP3043771.1 DUF5129 domain-containing protein [Arthrobacter jiangjiafuii]QWC10796.1 DUF5129 domain-containing protein [Arthrobacter jiangjiafuii]
MRRILATMLLLVITLAGGATAAAAVTPEEVVVEDTAGILDANTLLPALEDIEFREPTTVAVYTYNGPANSDNDTILNEEVLRFARAEHPEWLSEDGQKWADGLFIFALDPVGRWTGTYYGEDRKIPLNQQEDIREQTNDLFREAQWTDGTVAAVEEAAKLINRPWYLSPGAIFGAVVAAVAAAGSTITYVLVRRNRQRKNRKLLTTGDASYSSVTRDLDATEVNANTIPSDSSYGSRVLEEYRTFMTRYNKATALDNAAHALSSADLKRRSSTATVEEYAEAATELDGLDDVIADTNALLNKAPGWERAWDRQTAPLREDLDSLDGLLHGKDAAAKDSATAHALRAFRQQAREDLDAASAALADGRITPDQALDVIKAGRAELSDLLKNHAGTVIAAQAKTDSERKLMQKELDKAAGPGRRRNDYRPGIVDTAFPAYFYYSVGSFSSGIQHATSSVEAARSSASSSTGYGSSGGSFSGSGSSGQF